LQQAIGLTGELITPQEAAAAYQRDHQELSAQIVSSPRRIICRPSPSTPAAVAQFYTNLTSRNTVCPTACRSATSHLN